MNTIDNTRLTGLFKKELSDATIIGCGAIGSKVAIELSKAGIDRIVAYDMDVVEAHNIGNQAYFQKHVGMPKVDALKDTISEICSVSVDNRNEAFTEKHRITTPIVFLCVDSMDTRRKLMKRILESPVVEFVLESRMGIDEIRVYNVNRISYDKWLDCSNYDDSNAEVSACGTSLSVGSTSSIAASIMVWEYQKAHMEMDKSFEIIMSIENWGILCSA